jgi:hypothetical protein
MIGSENSFKVDKKEYKMKMTQFLQKFGRLGTKSLLRRIGPSIVRPKHGKYYDLIRLPHGHIPVPKVRLWSALPLKVKEVRDWCYFRCPSCGQPSFFKQTFSCSWCAYIEVSKSWYKHKKRREYFRSIKKKLEYLFLPFLILTGKAWYVSSIRTHHFDIMNNNCHINMKTVYSKVTIQTDLSENWS